MLQNLQLDMHTRRIFPRVELTQVAVDRKLTEITNMSNAKENFDYFCLYSRHTKESSDLRSDFGYLDFSNWRCFIGLSKTVIWESGIQSQRILKKSGTTIDTCLAKEFLNPFINLFHIQANQQLKQACSHAHTSDRTRINEQQLNGVK